jgi:hypothetical protein
MRTSFQKQAESEPNPNQFCPMFQSRKERGFFLKDRNLRIFLRGNGRLVFEIALARAEIHVIGRGLLQHLNEREGGYGDVGRVTGDRSGI